MNKLYFADCLEILKDLYKQHPDGFIDLIYIDPPFNSKRDYNVLFESLDLSDAKAQKQAFSDTWSNVSYIDTLNDILSLDMDLHSFLKNLDSIKVSKNVIAYLTTMAIRIYYMRKVLKNTGSFYLHCDPTMSHYLKIICDLIFGKKFFRNELIWLRKTSTGNVDIISNSHDIILRYSKTNDFIFNQHFSAYTTEYIHNLYKYKDEKGLYRLHDVVASPGLGGHSPRYEYNGYIPETRWLMIKEKLEKLDADGLLVYSKSGRPYRKLYLSEMKGKPLSDTWIDIEQASSKERLGYPTQKPETLLERIIKMSSNKGDLVADFFCGCGTTVAVSHRLKRNWIGVDISHLAIKLIYKRLTDKDIFSPATLKEFNIEIDGFPKDIASAQMLASEVQGGRLKFQDWIIEVMLGGISNTKKTGDGGFDGYMTFSKTDKEKGIIIIEVKSGNVTINNFRGFIQVVDKQKSDLGVFICFEKNKSSGMENLAKQQGYFECSLFPNRFEKIQIITVEDLLNGKEIHLPFEIYKRTTFTSSTLQSTSEDDIEDMSLFNDTD